MTPETTAKPAELSEATCPQCGAQLLIAVQADGQGWHVRVQGDAVASMHAADEPGEA